MFTIANPEKLLTLPKPEKDAYKGGPCPTCGEFACGTWRTPSAPVFCRNAHKWQRPGQIERMPHPFFGKGESKPSLDTQNIFGY